MSQSKHESPRTPVSRGFSSRTLFLNTSPSNTPSTPTFTFPFLPWWVRTTPTDSELRWSWKNSRTNYPTNSLNRWTPSLSSSYINRVRGNSYTPLTHPRVWFIPDVCLPLRDNYLTHLRDSFTGEGW